MILVKVYFNKRHKTTDKGFSAINTCDLKPRLKSRENIINLQFLFLFSTEHVCTTKHVYISFCLNSYSLANVRVTSL